MSSQTLSIVMEWENVQFSESSRVGRVLAALAQQVAEQVSELTAAGEGGPLRAPVELIVLFNSESTDGDEVAQIVSGALAECPAIAVRVVAAPGLAYFEMKNRGAELARGEVVVFLDSDVIPQPAWLATMLTAFADPAVQVVASRAYVRPDTLYSRTVALTWLFDLPPDTSSLQPAERVHANAIGFRRGVILEHPYPSIPSQSRGAGWDQFQSMRAAGIAVHEHTGARVEHPPPHGLVNYWRRGFAQGSDDFLSFLRHYGPRRSRVRRSIDRAQKKWRTALGKLWRHAGRVGLGPLSMPAAIGIMSSYYFAYFLGHLRASLGRIAPARQVAAEHHATPATSPPKRRAA